MVEHTIKIFGVKRECAERFHGVSPTVAAPVVAPAPSPATAPEILTPLQISILAALNGRALKVEQLAAQTGVEHSRLYRPGGLNELRATRRVEHRHGVGYFRPDCPPAIPEAAKNKVSTKSP
jgi:hypothetical protein